MSFYGIVVRVLKPMFGLLYNFRITGKENVPDGNFIVCANHTAYRDAIIVACAVKKDIRFVAKADLQRFFIFKIIFKAFKLIAIKRGESDRKALKLCCEALNNGECVGIFPQGQRTTEVPPSPEQVKAGMGYIADVTMSTVLPVRLIYKNNVPKMFNRTKVIIGKPIPYEEYSSIDGGSATKQRISEYIFGKLCELE